MTNKSVTRCWVICWLTLVAVSVPHQRRVRVQRRLVTQPVSRHRNAPGTKQPGSCVAETLRANLSVSHDRQLGAPGAWSTRTEAVHEQPLGLVAPGRRTEESRGRRWWRPSRSRLVPPNSSGSTGLGGFCAAWWMLSPWKRWIFVTSRMRTLLGILLGLIKNLVLFPLLERPQTSTQVHVESTRP